VDVVIARDVLDSLGHQGRHWRTVMDDRLLYRIPEVADHLNVSRSKVYELLKTGRLRSVHIDRTRLVRRADLEAYVASLATAR
jgi:excisionase family DNA binding protein